MNDAIVKRPRSIPDQKIAAFTGEGAYHGSTKPRPQAVRVAPAVVVEEMRPTTLEAYAAAGVRSIADFEATFPNRYDVRAILPVPAQDEIMADGVTFCWCHIDEAIAEAGPLTRRVLEEMTKHLRRDKRFVYIDSKIQWFEQGDVPVDSRHWHLDGSIAVRDERVQALGHRLLHDMRARLDGAAPPTYLAYQSSTHCATQFATAPVALRMPELIPNFDELDRQVRALDPPCEAQPASSIVGFDGLSLHRAVAARSAGWRLWIRCTETDHEIRLNPSIVACYGTVFRHG
ncbi:MAG: hypothetical protein KIT31_32395 [Deltaproteobacteria bacterium]|nr:hypothetical protein [Deltaproteobacteria bacterium]